MNILIVTADQWRADHLDLDGTGPVATPHLAALAAEGTAFLQHYGQASPCGPARASLFTGRYAFNHRSITNGTPLDGQLTNLALELRRAGMDPVLFGYTDTSADPRILPAADPRLRTYEGVLPGFRAELLLPEDGGPWLDHLAARGYGRMTVEDAYGSGLGEAARWSAADSETAFLTNEAIGWLARQPRGRPWCAHLSYIKPHPPWVVAAPWHSLVDPARMLPPRRAPSPELQGETHPFVGALLAQPFSGWLGRTFARPNRLDPLTVARVRGLYAGLVAEFDHHLGHVLDAIRGRGEWDDTLVIVTSDHGEFLGDHWLLGKSAFFPAAFHVPLIIRDPRPSRVRGRRVAAFTEHVDILPTVLEAAGLPVPLQCDGRTLSVFLTGEQPGDWRQEAYYELDFRDVEEAGTGKRLGLAPEASSLAVLLDKKTAYVHFTGLEPILVDRRADPAWSRNLAREPTAQRRLLAAAQSMLSLRMLHADRRLSCCRLTGEGPVGNYDPLPPSFRA